MPTSPAFVGPIAPQRAPATPPPTTSNATAEVAQLNHKHLKRGYYLAALNISLLLVAGFMTTEAWDDISGVICCLVGLLLTQIYGITLLNSKKRSNKLGLLYLGNLYILCYVLNTTFQLFAQPTLAWAAYCSMMIGVLLLDPLVDQMSGWKYKTYHFAAGLTIVGLVHQTVFLFEVDQVWVAAIGLLIMGGGLLLFVPTLALLGLLIHLRRRGVERSSQAFVAVGIALPMMVMTLFAAVHSAKLDQVEAISAASKPEDRVLRILEQITPDIMTRLAFTAEANYQLKSNLNSSSWWTRTRQHSPLLVWAMHLHPAPSIIQQNKAKFKRFFAGTGHDNEEALWSAEGLSTDHIEVAHVVDKATATVRTRYDFTVSSTQSRQGEAIYTFQLPPGGVVTNSSLWVFGVEQPARLSTRSKAREAYRTVVGRERRDPALVEWRNANTVAMRIFPVVDTLARRFSIEVTAPLQQNSNGFEVASIGVQGPPTGFTKVKTSIRYTGDRLLTDSYSFRGYTPERYSVELAEISPSTYVADGTAYTLEPAKPNYAPRAIVRAYVDLTGRWTSPELRQLTTWAAAAKILLVGYDGELFRLDESNVDAAKLRGSERQRSLFPVQLLSYQDSVLLITREQKYPLTIDDYSEDDKYAIKAWSHFGKLAVVHVGEELPSYLQTIVDMGGASADVGTLDLARRALVDGEVRERMDGPGLVELDGINARIVALPSNASDSGADPALLQLFNYRQSLLAHQLTEATEDAQLAAIDFAKRANIVTPFSSQIILETDADYARFGIANVIGPKGVAPPASGEAPVAAVSDSEATVADARAVQRAFDEQSGAVPEPHEWALMVLGIAVLVLLYFRKR